MTSTDEGMIEPTEPSEAVVPTAPIAPIEGRWDPRLCVNSLSSRNWTLQQDLDCYERLGIRRISVFLPKLLAAGLDRAVDEISARGLRVDGVLPGSSFDLSDEASWPRTREALLMAVEAARRLGATTVQTPGGSARGESYEVAAGRFGDALSPVIVAGTQLEIRLALEPTRPQFAHIGFVHTVRDALALAAHLGIWIVPDTAHSWWEPGIEEVLAGGAPRIAVIQVADLAFGAPVLERLVPGDGAIRLASFLAAPLEAGFGGPIELEIIGSAIEEEGYEGAIRRSFAHLTRLLAVRN
jgi:sugar phosphate isomerase/epimerase